MKRCFNVITSILFLAALLGIVLIVLARNRINNLSPTDYIADYLEQPDGSLEGFAPIIEYAIEPSIMPTIEPELELTSETSEPTPELEAQQLEISVSCDGIMQPDAVDGNYYTKIRLFGGTSIQIKAEERICALYIVWEDYPQPWTLRSDGQEEIHGENGFLHELVHISNPAAELELQVANGRSHYIADIYAFSDGCLPGWVQDWQVPWDDADLLVVPTHSDDEFIFMGGVIPYSIEKGMKVQVIYLVKHYRQRRHEQLNSLWVAGVTHVPVISECEDIYVTNLDQAMRVYNTKNLTGYLVEQIRRFRPKVIVGHAEDGDSGHIVHILGVICLKNAVELAATPGLYPESEKQYGLYDVPKLYLHLFGPEEEMTRLDYETPLTHFNGATAFQVACDAFAQCTSQTAKNYYEVYGSDSPHDTHRFGLFRSLVGLDEEKNDLFEHLDFSDPY